MHSVVSRLLFTARDCSEHFRALSGTSGRFRALPGSLRRSQKAPDSARKCPKAHETAPSSFGQYGNG
eukprot:3334159-Alexandrium_andersonii.AAC.1